MGYKRKGTIFLIAAAVMIMALSVAYLSWGRIVLGIFARTNHLELSYERIKKTSFDEFLIADLRVTDQKTALSISAKDARLKFALHDIFFNCPAVSFDLTDWRFLKNGSGEAGTYDSLSGLVGIPFDKERGYKSLSGSMKTLGDTLEIRDLTALSDDIKLTLNGTVKGKLLDLDIVIYFSDLLTARVPEQLSKTLLSREQDGWSSLAIHLEGDYDMPAVKVTSKLFRLNIKAVSRAKN